MASVKQSIEFEQGQFKIKEKDLRVKIGIGQKLVQSKLGQKVYTYYIAKRKQQKEGFSQFSLKAVLDYILLLKIC